MSPVAKFFLQKITSGYKMAPTTNNLMKQNASCYKMFPSKMYIYLPCYKTSPVAKRRVLHAVGTSLATKLKLFNKFDILSRRRFEVICTKLRFVKKMSWWGERFVGICIKEKTFCRRKVRHYRVGYIFIATCRHHPSCKRSIFL